MRKITIGLLLLAGCGHLGQLRPENVQEQSLTAKQIQNAQRIVITQSSYALWNGQSTQWVFAADGKCFGEGVSTFNGTQSEKKLLTLPPTTFHEVQKILLTSRYFSLKDGFSSFQFEGGRSLKVECAGRTHSISFGEMPPEARQLWEYLNGLSSRDFPFHSASLASSTR